MKALTLKHPWAWAVCCLGKRLENRTWTPAPSLLRPGESFAVHGGKPPSGPVQQRVVRIAAHGLARRHDPGFLSRVPEGDRRRDVFAFSGLVAVCVYGGFVTRSSDPWFEGPFGWVLSDLFVLPEPVACPGKQGLWEVEGALLGRVTAQRKGVPGCPS